MKICGVCLTLWWLPVLLLGVGLHVLFPVGQPVNWFGFILCVVAFVGMVKWKWGIIPVVLGAGAVGMLHHLIASRVAA